MQWGKKVFGICIDFRPNTFLITASVLLLDKLYTWFENNLVHKNNILRWYQWIQWSGVQRVVKGSNSFLLCSFLLFVDKCII